MEYNTETDLILNSLMKEKKALADKMSEIDKVIKRIRYGSLNLGGSKGLKASNDRAATDTMQEPKAFPLKAELKVQVIKCLKLF